MRRVKVTIFGLFPTTFSMCAPCCPTNYFHQCDTDMEIGEYSFNMRRNQEFLTNTIYSLYEYMDRVRIEVVSADSIKGLLYGIRYRIGRGPAIIVNGKVFRGEDIDIDKVKEEINKLLVK